MKPFPKVISVKSAVGIGEAPGGGFGLVVDLDVELQGVSQANAGGSVAGGHRVCPIRGPSRAIQDVKLKATAIP